ncbi:hypothetical protein CXR04_07230 [Streptomyces sp. CMB-StM0423]|nr:hypothetical protein CXR04_07230 [Streptomyces sp. CMB-StM0423]
MPGLLQVVGDAGPALPRRPGDRLTERHGAGEQGAFVLRRGDPADERAAGGPVEERGRGGGDGGEDRDEHAEAGEGGQVGAGLAPGAGAAGGAGRPVGGALPARIARG